jgi:transcriptional regulator with XRE-family HTH domain
MAVRVDAARLREVRAALGLTQAQMAEAIGLSGTDPARTIRNWEAGETITGPAQLAIAYLGQGALDATMQRVVPEFVEGADLGDNPAAEQREFIVRLWRPRFVATVLSAEMPVPTGAVWAWIERDIERLVAGLWIDDPAAPPGFDVQALVERAANFYQLRSLDSLA